MKKLLTLLMATILVVSSAASVTAASMAETEIVAETQMEENSTETPQEELPIESECDESDEVPETTDTLDTSECVESESEEGIFPVKESKPETESELETETEEIEESAERPDRTYTLNLKYDDEYDLSKLIDGKLEIREITDETVTSYQVTKGKKTAKLDEFLLLIDDMKIHTTATGNCKLWGTDADGQEILVEVTVEPAILTMIFLAGQSNMQGTCGNGIYELKNSVSCNVGTVYASFAPYSTAVARLVTGVSSLQACTIDNMNQYVPGSLISDLNCNGSTLAWPINSLTADGTGKAGPDAAIAYEWNRLTKEKVWVVNASHGGSAMKTWVPGQNNYDFALAFFERCMVTYEAEISAGHYQTGRKLMFWMQGEADRTVSAASYASNFQKMYTGFQSTLGITHLGVITVRSSLDTNKYSDDLTMTASRVISYTIRQSKSTLNMAVVSNVNEQWISNSGVKNYFQSKYSGGKLTYPVHSGGSKSLPTTLDDVHPDVHYRQKAHNENGLTAAENMYRLVMDDSAASDELYWVDKSGQPTTMIIGNLSNSAIAKAKDCIATRLITVTASDGLIYNKSTGQVTAAVTGRYTLKANLGSNTATVNYYQCEEAKSLKSSLCYEGIRLDWTNVSSASGYRIYRKSMDSYAEQNAYQLIDTISRSSISYIDKTAEDHKNYQYAVAALNSKGEPSYVYIGEQILQLKAPVLKKAVDVSSGIQLEWERTPRAQEYRLYRKQIGVDSKWKRIAVLTTNSYIDKNVKYNQTYVYTVRAVTAEGISSYKTDGITKKYNVAKPMFTVSGEEGKVTIKWAKISAASEYRVYRYDKATGVYTRLATTTGTTYTDIKREAGTTYTYLVRSNVKGVLSLYGAEDRQSVKTLCERPKVTYTSTKTEITLKWAKVKGATKYRVYSYNPTTKKYSILKDITTNTYKITKLSSNKSYSYLVRAYNGTAFSNYSKNENVVVCKTK